MRSKKGFQANRVLSYSKAEWVTLATVTASGLIYNIGLLAAPWFEGRMAGRLVDILGGSGALPSMLRLAVCYAAVTALVQGARYEALDETIRSKQSRWAEIEAFLSSLEKAELVERFETGLWCGLADYATVYAKDDVRFTFNNGQEIRA